jgi:tetratricopeptide (TPR) repeat protein
MTRHYDQALAQLQKTLQMQPDYLLARVALGRVYVQLRRYDDALSLFRTLTSSPNAEAKGWRIWLTFTHELAGALKPKRYLIGCVKCMLEGKLAIAILTATSTVISSRKLSRPWRRETGSRVAQ